MESRFTSAILLCASSPCHTNLFPKLRWCNHEGHSTRGRYCHASAATKTRSRTPRGLNSRPNFTASISVPMAFDSPDHNEMTCRSRPLRYTGRSPSHCQFINTPHAPRTYRGDRPQIHAATTCRFQRVNKQAYTNTPWRQQQADNVVLRGGRVRRRYSYVSAWRLFLVHSILREH
jgi:hypothetical protein